MAKKFKRLRKVMIPEAQARSHAKAMAMSPVNEPFGIDNHGGFLPAVVQEMHQLVAAAWER